MIIFFYGEDTFRSHQKVLALKKKFLQADPSGLNLLSQKSEDLVFQQTASFLQTAPLLSRSRFLIIQNIFQKGKYFTDLQKKFLAFLKKTTLPSSTIVLFHHQGRPDRRAAFFKYLSRQKIAQEFSPLNPIEEAKWIQNEVKNRQAQITAEAAGRLAAFCGPDLWTVSNEIDKLIAYRSSDNHSPVEITLNDVNLLVESNLSANIFEFTDALGDKNKKRALELLHHQLAAGQNALYLLSMISFQLRHILMVKDLAQTTADPTQISRQLKIHPFLAKNCLAMSAKFSLPELLSIFQRVIRCDSLWKSTTINPLVAFDNLILEICQG